MVGRQRGIIFKRVDHIQGELYLEQAPVDKRLWAIFVESRPRSNNMVFLLYGLRVLRDWVVFGVVLPSPIQV